jgi:hypothetical protein
MLTWRQTVANGGEGLRVLMRVFGPPGLETFAPVWHRVFQGLSIESTLIRHRRLLIKQRIGLALRQSAVWTYL